MNYIGYYRVSTNKQGQSGLGLSAQKEAVRRYVESVGGTLVAEHKDVISGSKVNRPGLEKVKKQAQEHEAIVVVKAIDRLSREGFEVAITMDKLGITVIDCDSPGDGGLIRDIKLSMAKDERNKIKQRTTAALAQIKKTIKKKGYHVAKSGRKIKKLGTVENLGGEKAIERSVATRRKKAMEDDNNKKATSVIMLMRKSGETYRTIAAYLTKNGFKTSRGNDFSPAQVRNLEMRVNK